MIFSRWLLCYIHSWFALLILAAGLVLGLLLHQIVILNPESQRIHNHRYEKHHQYQLQLGVVAHPAHNQLGDGHNGLTEFILYCEQHRLHTQYDGIPN